MAHSNNPPHTVLTPIKILCIIKMFLPFRILYPVRMPQLVEKSTHIESSPLSEFPALLDLHVDRIPGPVRIGIPIRNLYLGKKKKSLFALLKISTVLEFHAPSRIWLI